MTPIICQQTNVQNDTDTDHEFHLMLTSYTRMGKKGDLSDFEHDMVVGARWAGMSISETADLLGFSCTAIRTV